MLTQQQLATLKAAIFAETAPSIVQARAPETRDDRVIASFYNTDSPTKRWARVMPDKLRDAIDLSEMDGLTQGKRDVIDWALTVFNGYDATTAAGRKAITDSFPSSGAQNSRVAVLAAATPFASRFEMLFPTTDATSLGNQAVTAKVLTVYGPVSIDEVAAAMNLP